LYVPCDASFEGILEKTIISFKWVLENVEFDYLIRSNTSTYFEVSSIAERINQIKEGQLGGTFETNRKHLLGFPKGYRYLNGSGLYMTRNSAKILEYSNSEISINSIRNFRRRIFNYFKHIAFIA
jgi:hypothetical protein